MVAWIRPLASAATATVLLVGCTGQAGTQSPTPTAASSSTTSRLPWPSSPSSELPATTGDRLQAELDRWVRTGFFPGLTAAVVTPEGEWAGAAGVDGKGAALQASSGMAVASITKTFTAAEVMLLAERGQVDLDVPASTYLPVPWVANGTTVRQLLGHRSGIHDATAEDAYADLSRRPNRHWSARQFLGEVRKPAAPPGRAWDYADANFVLLGLLIEGVTHTGAATAVRRDLWTPLGLDRLAYQDAEVLAPPRAGAGEDEMPATRVAQQYLPFRSVASAAGAAGGVAGDAASIARWGYELYGARLLTPGSVAEMTDFADGDGYGLGTFDYTDDHWYTAHVDGFGHHGVLPGYRTVLAVYPTERLSIAVLTPSTVDPLPYVRYLERAVAAP